MIDSTIYAEDSNHKYMAAIYKETVDYLGFSITKKVIYFDFSIIKYIIHLTELNNARAWKKMGN